MPGVIAVVMTLIGAQLTALLMAREWEHGTMEALMVTPVSMPEVLLGKILPYFILGMGGLALSVIMGVWLFEVPLRGSVGVLVSGSSFFLLTALGMGLLISTVTLLVTALSVAREREQGTFDQFWPMVLIATFTQSSAAWLFRRRMY